MGRIGITSGGAGDIIYSIPIMKMIGIDTLLIKESFYPPGFGSLYSTCKPLVESQGITCEPTPDTGQGFDNFHPDAKYDINMDAWRTGPRYPYRGKEPIILSMMMHWRVFNRNWKLPWLKDIPVSDQGYNLVFLTDRWRNNSTVDWSAVYKKIRIPVFFLGHPEDHEHFCKMHGHIDWMPTRDLLEMAKLIAGCTALYTNQGCALVLAQSLGKNYFLEVKPTKTNVLLNTPNEHLL